MTDHAQLKQRIQECCPELLELSFGCEVYLKPYDEEGPYRVLGKIGICNRHKKTHEECYEPGNKCDVNDGYWLLGGDDESDGMWEFQVLENEIGEILGHPIELQHVLRTIKKLPDNKWRGGWGCIPDDDLAKFVLYDWDLTQDLDHQSEETKSWLEKVILGI